MERNRRIWMAGTVVVGLIAAAFAVSFLGGRDTVQVAESMPCCEPIVSIDGVHHLLDRGSGGHEIVASTDFVSWERVPTPAGELLGFGTAADQLRVATRSPSGSLVVSERTGEDWTVVQSVDGAVQSTDRIHELALLDGGVVVLAEAATGDWSLVMAPTRGETTVHDLPVGPSGAALRVHGTVALLQSWGPDPLAWVVELGGEPLELRGPGEQQTYRLRADGAVLALPAESDEPIHVAPQPFDVWLELMDGPRYTERAVRFDEFPFMDEACGGRFDANHDGELLLYYTYCDGRVWVSYRNGPWVRAGDMGLGDADAHVEPVAVVGGQAIVNTYEGVFAVPLE